MPLIDLKSDLAWYGKKPPGFRPNQSRENTDYSYNKDLTSTTTVQGFSDKGNPVSFKQVTSANKFVIGDDSTATRLAQLGAGTKFPIGPEGQVHEFDITRTGFSPDTRYGDVYNKLLNSGLANTYTANSPIDDMYNKFNLRDDATPNFGWVKQPYMLRGIQREGSSKPQYWGLGNTIGGKISGLIDVPRSGPLTAGERILIDAARIGKFLISPYGIAFLAKQQGLTLTNPSVETEQGAVARTGAQKIYNPLSLFSSGIAHIPRQLGDYGGKLGAALGLPKVRYEDIVVAGRTQDEKNDYNRLVWLKDWLMGPLGKSTTVISNSLTGPDSAFGIGRTVINRYENTLLSQEQFRVSGNKEIPIGISRTTSNSLDKFQENRKFVQELDEEFEFDGLIRTTRDDEYIKPKYGGDIVPPDPNTNLYKQLSYGEIKKAAAKSTGKPRVVPYDFLTRDDYSQYNLARQREKDTFINSDGSASSGLIDFIVGGVRLKAYISDISDSISADWEGQKDQGRADKRYIYGGVDRTIDVSFMAAAESYEDVSATYSKLKRLARYCYPVYGDYAFHGEFVKVTIGSLHRYTPMILTEVSFGWDAETPWALPGSIKSYNPESGVIEYVTEDELRKGRGWPLVTSVDCSFVYIGTVIQDSSAPIFG